eukprot:2578213-Prymnesium_polylepis.1
MAARARGPAPGRTRLVTADVWFTARVANGYLSQSPPEDNDTAPSDPLAQMQRHAAQDPLHRALVRLEVHRRDEVQTRALRRAVDGARVDGVTHLRLVNRARGGNVQNGQRRVDDLRVGIGKHAFAPVPLAAVEEEAVDVDALRRSVLDVVPVLLQDFIRRDAVIERPAIARVLTADILPVGGEEA